MRNSIINSSYDIIIFSESWLFDGISNAELNFFGYNVYREDRNCDSSQKSIGGGVLIAVKCDIACKKIPNPDNMIEQVWVILHLKNRDVLLGSIYIPPREKHEKYELLSRSIIKLKSLYPSAEILTTGDFNLPNVVWFNNRYSAEFYFSNDTERSVKTSTTALSYAIDYLNLYQKNDIVYGNKSMLDLVFTSIDDLKCYRAKKPISKVDKYHPPIEILLNVRSPIKPYIEYEYLDYDRCDYDAITKKLNSYNWFDIVSDDDINVVIDKFYSILYEVIDLFVPKVIKKQDAFPLWFDATLKRKTLEKKIAHSNYKKYVVIGGLCNFCETSFRMFKDESFIAFELSEKN